MAKRHQGPVQLPVAAEPEAACDPPPDGIPERRRYPALGIQHRTAVPRSDQPRQSEVLAGVSVEA